MCSARAFTRGVLKRMKKIPGYSDENRSDYGQLVDNFGRIPEISRECRREVRKIFRKSTLNQSVLGSSQC